MTGHGRVAKRAFSAATLTAIGFVLSAGADNLREIVLGAGGEFAFAHHALLAPGDAVAARAFDGDCFGLGDAGRCLGSAGMHVAAGFPGSVVPDGCKLAITRYRVYQLQEATGCHSRAPRAWRIEGASALDGTYAVIDSQSGVQWYSDTVSGLADNAPLPAGETNWREFTIDPGTNTDWRAFKFVPLQSKASGAYVYGFREVEFYGTVYRPEDGYCEVAPSRLPLGEVHPGYGAVCATGAVFTASVTEVSYNGGNYRLAGWRREKWTDAGWATVETGTGTSFEYSPDGGIYRFGWEWAADAVRLATSIENDLGVERIEISPASADGFYAADEVVTLTARGATAPHTSSFVCWKGVLPDGTDASSPVISVTMDRARTITAQFDRSGWQWTLMPDFALDGATVPVLTDGLWILRVSDCTAGTAEGKQIDSCLNGYGMLDLSQVKSAASLDVLAIADGAFDGNKSITGLKCPEELVRIGKQAFNEAKNLDSVEFGANLESIGLKAFHHCRFDYATLDLSRCAKLREIGSYAFQYAKAERVILPPRIPEFGLQVFTYMEKLLEVAATVPGNDQFKAVKKASFPHADVFGGCAKLRTVEIPGGSAVSFTSLRGLPQLRKVKFHGKAPAAFPDFFSAFGSVQAPPSYQVRIEVSPNVDAAGWLAHARAATDEELSRTDCPGANVAGVIDCANGNKAWLTWGKSMFDPKGLVVTIR